MRSQQCDSFSVCHVIEFKYALIQIYLVGAEPEMDELSPCHIPYEHLSWFYYSKTVVTMTVVSVFSMHDEYFEKCIRVCSHL